MTLKGLHDTIQAAFLWHDAHLWEFEVDQRRYRPEADNFLGERTYKAANMKLTRLRGAAIRAGIDEPAIKQRLAPLAKARGRKRR